MSKTEKAFSLICCILMICGLLVFDATVMAVSTTLDNCNSATGWTGSDVVNLDATNMREGTGCLTKTGIGIDWFKKTFSPAINSGVTEANGYLHVWLYVSDVSKFSADGQIEITSSGGPDVNEYAWLGSSMSLVSGWNEKYLKISSAIKTGTPNLSAINFFRVYRPFSASVTCKIDDLKFTDTLTGATPTATSSFSPTPTKTPTPTSGGTPDLIVTDISWSPSSPNVGNGVTFSATVKNQGTGATPGGVVMGIGFYLDGGAGAFVWSDNYTTSLGAGASLTLTVNGGTSGPTWTATSGTHTIKAWVDDVNRIAESNEANNQYSESLTVGGGGGATPTATTTPPPSGGDVVGKVIVGYQGWFNATGDGSPIGYWRHWSNANPPGPGSQTFELYPAVSGYTTLFQTNYANLGNGQAAKLFSSYTDQTVNLHFQWMRDYGIDGAALQRFGNELSGASKTNRDNISSKVKTAAETYGRKFYIMYDISGMGTNFDSVLESDWTNTIINSLRLTSSSAYAKQNGKPVVCIWGIGFNDGSHPGTATQCINFINWFKNQGCYVIGGVPTYWRDCDNSRPFSPDPNAANDSKTGFQNVYKTFNMIQPWFVGRIRGISGTWSCNNYKTYIIGPDWNYCKTNGMDYAPVMFPGFAWSNWNGGPRNEIPRVHGDFLWNQAYNVRTLGIPSAYVAMFDEYDEATAIAKAAEDSSMKPTNQYFLTLDADGVHCTSDFYLRLTGDATKMIKGTLGATASHSTTH